MLAKKYILLFLIYLTVPFFFYYLATKADNWNSKAIGGDCIVTEIKKTHSGTGSFKGQIKIMAKTKFENVIFDIVIRNNNYLKHEEEINNYHVNQTIVCYYQNDNPVDIKFRLEDSHLWWDFFLFFAIIPNLFCFILTIYLCSKSKNVLNERKLN